MTSKWTLPCGCRIDIDVIDGARTFVIEPCSLTCKYYRFAFEESERQGKTPRIIDMR